MAGNPELVQRFIEKGVHLTPGAFDVVAEASDPEVERVLSDLEERKEKPPVINDEAISRILNSEETILSSPEISGKEGSTGEVERGGRRCEAAKRAVEMKSDEPLEGQERLGGRMKILRDITNKSTTEGKVEDFVQLFRDRYERISSMIRSREGFQNNVELGNMKRHQGEDVNLVGLVNSKRETRKKDAWIIEIEDFSGKAVIYVKKSDRNKKVMEKIEQVVTDEVIGVKARVPNELKSGNRNPLVWGNDIIWPDLPVSGSNSPGGGEEVDASGYAVLISDLHVGSNMFLPDVFDRFLNWLKGEAGNEKQRELAEEVKYLMIAGDLVDGIGIYPNQQEELDIENVRDQYEKVAELLSRVPEDISIIAAPGNHDAVRLAEPQPALYSEPAEPLHEINVQLVGNPSLLDIEGVKFLIYHGMGFDDLASANSDLDRRNVVPPMKEMMKKRHLAPIYGEPMGGKTPIAPEKEDYMVIEEVPDVFHCGHLHIYGCGEYRETLLVNSATFQEQTSFMKRQGIVPTPGRVPIVNLKTKEVRTINFA